MNDLCQAIEVWRRLSDGWLVRYRCFNVLSTGKYCVQSSDFYALPIEPQPMGSLDAQYLELLAEQPPNERSGMFDTLEAAIENHEREFASSDGEKVSG